MVGVIGKAFAGLGKGLTQVGLIQLENDAAEMRMRRLAELEASLRGTEAATERDWRSKEASTEAGRRSEELEKKHILDLDVVSKGKELESEYREEEHKRNIEEKKVEADAESKKPIIVKKGDRGIFNPATRETTPFGDVSQEAMENYPVPIHLPNGETRTIELSPSSALAHYKQQFEFPDDGLMMSNYQEWKRLTSEAAAKAPPYNNFIIDMITKGISQEEWERIPKPPSEESKAKATEEAESKAGWMSLDESDFGSKGKEAWIIDRARQMESADKAKPEERKPITRQPRSQVAPQIAKPRESKEPGIIEKQIEKQPREFTDATKMQQKPLMADTLGRIKEDRFSKAKERVAGRKVDPNAKGAAGAVTRVVKAIQENTPPYLADVILAKQITATSGDKDLMLILNDLETRITAELREGEATEFNNGHIWTIENGKPKRLK